jgi:hypothetical protein
VGWPICDEYAVLMTDCAQEISAIAQFYRERANSENGFDKLKNQWGWGLHHQGHQTLRVCGACAAGN